MKYKPKWINYVPFQQNNSIHEEIKRKIPNRRMQLKWKETNHLKKTFCEYIFLFSYFPLFISTNIQKNRLLL